MILPYFQVIRFWCINGFIYAPISHLIYARAKKSDNAYPFCIRTIYICKLLQTNNHLMVNFPSQTFVTFYFGSCFSGKDDAREL